MEKLLLIINPCAGQKKAKKQLAEIIDIFNRADFTVITHITSASGDAEAACILYADQVDRIVCCGGDGTFNETVSGLLKSGKDIPIGYIPAGSTNDFAASLGLTGGFTELAERIVKGTPTPIDVGSFGARYFTYVASFGAFTRASYSAPQNIKNALGHTAYLLEGIQELSQIRKVRVKMEMDERTVEDEFLFGAICNSTSLGGVLTLDPKQVDLSDGKFEVLLVRMPRDLSEIKECIQAVQKQKYNCKMITFQSTSTVKITAPPDMPWTLDGEREDGHWQAEVKNLHHAIRLLK